MAEVVASLKTIDLRNAESQAGMSRDVKTLQALLNLFLTAGDRFQRHRGGRNILRPKRLCARGQYQSFARSRRRQRPRLFHSPLPAPFSSRSSVGGECGFNGVAPSSTRVPAFGEEIGGSNPLISTRKCAQNGVIS